MTADKYIYVFSELGRRLRNAVSGPEFGYNAAEAIAGNGWFTRADIEFQIESICTQMLDEDRLNQWYRSYYPAPAHDSKRVLIIMAGNIPLVGFFDLMCTLMSGHAAIIKPSSKDRVLVEYIVDILKSIDTDIPVSFYTGHEEVDALVAMGGDNAVRIFRERFNGIPVLLRDSRFSVAVVDGNETPEELSGLSDDITSYCGLGCRNVGLLFVPTGYDLQIICRKISCTKHVNNKINNNYRQRKALLTMTGVTFADCGNRILVECSDFPQAISQINYIYYNSKDEIAEWLVGNDSDIQCVVGHFEHPRAVGFGLSQRPELTDYPDGNDTMKFLLSV